MKWFFCHMIRFYQRNISPFLPSQCRFVPTCSQYALEAVERYGPWRGGWLALKRLMRCNPFNKSNPFDPVP